MSENEPETLSLSPREERQLDDWEAQEHQAEEYPDPEAGC